MIGWIKLVIIGISVLILLGLSIKIIQDYERAIRLRFGRRKDVLSSGLNLIIPFVDQIYKVDMRQKTLDLPSQSVMSKDNVSLNIDGVVFYIVRDAQKSFLNVQNIKKQIEAKASSELKEIIGSMTMNEALEGREKIAKELIKRLQEEVMDIKEEDLEKRMEWGVEIKSIQINDVKIPTELVRAMSKVAEATREKESRVIKAEGEELASKKLKSVADVYRGNPEALEIRKLQTWTEIGTEHNSLIIVIPEKSGVNDALSLTAIGKLDELLKQREKRIKK